jgi:hypothetical protein
LDERALEGLKGIKEWKTLDQGIATLLVAALDPSLNSTSFFFLVLFLYLSFDFFYHFWIS